MKKLSLYIFYLVIGYMPLHVFLSNWVGSSFGILEITKILKDVVPVIGFLLILSVTKIQVIRALLKHNLVLIILVYALLTIITVFLRPTDIDAEILGIVYNLRYLVFFMYGALLVKSFGVSVIKNTTKIVIIVGVIVTLFGVVQVTLLPDSFLTHFGYSKSTGSLPVFYISDINKVAERAFSTIKDPNSLGAYLIIIGTLSIAFLINQIKPYKPNKYWVLVALTFFGIIISLSRSAWLGTIAMLITLFLVMPKTSAWIRRKWKSFALVGVLILVLMPYGFLTLRNTGTFRNLLLHIGDNTPVTSNSQRIVVYGTVFKKIFDKPLGHGLGTAGPVSFKNNVEGPFLTENYYLQIGYEVGWLGLVLFLGILSIIAKKLYSITRTSPMATVLLASFVGILVANAFVHIWGNEAVAYTWWGLAGLVVLSNNKQDYEVKEI